MAVSPTRVDAKMKKGDADLQETVVMVTTTNPDLANNVKSVLEVGCKTAMAAMEKQSNRVKIASTKVIKPTADGKSVTFRQGQHQALNPDP